MTGSGFWTTWSGGLLALVATLALTPLVIRAARRFGWVDRPRENRWHEETTALMGGIAIFGGATLGVLWSVSLDRLGPLWGGATLLFGIGLIDDVRGVGPAAKLTVQIVATALLLYAGYEFGQDWPLWLSGPLTVLWTVGITNAFNLLDNMDGLSAGVGGIAATVLALFSVLVGSPLGVALGASVAGAAFGFLVFNFKPARIFMGDCGSHFLGFVVATEALIVQQQSPEGGAVAIALVPIAVLAVPILDTILVTLLRKLSGRSVFEGGRDHSSHRLVFLGLSERKAVLVLYGVSLLSGGLALLVLVVNVHLFYAVTVFVGVGLGVFGVTLSRARVSPSTTSSEADASSNDGLPHLLHRWGGHRWKTFVGVLGDAVLVGAAFVVAHHLRFENGLPAGHADRMAEALPLVIAAKGTVFFLAGLYRGIWRHAGTPELVRTGGATVAASGASFVGMATLHGVAEISASVLVIDWMVVFLAVAGARFGFRGLRQYFAAKSDNVSRTLLYGAGDLGLLALRALRHHPDHDVEPVAFVDDEPLKQNQSVQGLPVLGTGRDIPQLCEQHGIDEVIFTSNTVPEDQKRAIRRACTERRVHCRRFSFSLDPLETSGQDASVAVVSGDGQA